MKILLNKFAAFLILIILISCSKEQIVPKYYVLEPIREIQIINNEKIAVNVSVKSFSVPGIYNQKRIVLRRDSNELQYYFYHMWAEKPSIAIRYFIKAYFENAATFKSCNINSIAQKPDYFITGDLDLIERKKSDDREFIALRMNVKLVDVIKGEIVITHNVHREETIDAGTSMNVFAQMVSKILTEEMNHFSRKTETYFKQQEY
ncbi:membrane integrity-associated transporter subunit PqiC [bacterium]|nr:membrane integrity-associated transporter subunit PqiC [bacterium]